MHYKRIEQLQKDYGVDGIQAQINDGSAWTLEGSVGRACVRSLENGETMLPKTGKRGAYNNYIPSRYDVKPGTKGSFKHCSDFWDKVESGDIDFDE